jgi:hypothetical protein
MTLGIAMLSGLHLKCPCTLVQDQMYLEAGDVCFLIHSAAFTQVSFKTLCISLPVILSFFSF